MNSEKPWWMVEIEWRSPNGDEPKEWEAWVIPDWELRETIEYIAAQGYMVIPGQGLTSNKAQEIREMWREALYGRSRL